jgi:hypothetical protein
MVTPPHPFHVTRYILAAIITINIICTAKDLSTEQSPRGTETDTT